LGLRTIKYRSHLFVAISLRDIILGMPLEAPIVPTKEMLLNRWEEIVSHVPDLFEDNPERIETDAFGNILMSPPPGYHHQKCCFRIASLLEKLLPGNGTVLEQYVLTDEGIRMPDVIWLSPERVEKYPDQPISPAPDICVEVRSPSNAIRELE
jgi:Uma2 family endonuclease